MAPNPPGGEIHEGRGRFPWWAWVALAVWLGYALLLAPFDLTSPLP